MKKYILVIILFIIGFYLAINRQKNVEVTNISSVRTDFAIVKKSAEEGIDIEVEPKASSDKKTWSFEITLTTHEGSLDQDLETGSVLENEKNIQLNPLGWEGSPPGGHHREGVLSFPAFLEEPKNVTLKLSGFGQKYRIFNWDLNNL